jgi:hypothetical protein
MAKFGIPTDPVTNTMILGQDLFPQIVDIAQVTMIASAANEVTRTTGKVGAVLGVPVIFSPLIGNHVGGNIVAATAVTASPTAKGSSLIQINVVGGGNFNVGDTLLISGQKQSYVVTSSIAVGATLNVSVYPLIQSAIPSNVLCIPIVKSGYQGFLFNNLTVELASYELPVFSTDYAGGLFYRETLPENKLSLRVRKHVNSAGFYNLDIDVMFGVGIANPNTGVRLIGGV